MINTEQSTAKWILILDLDGVLITTPPWKADEMDADGYSMFNKGCVENLNQLLSQASFDIWLSSSRRRETDLEAFNEIFSYRNIQQAIVGFLPVYPNCKNRREEVEQFIRQEAPQHYLILDDDKSLSALSEPFKAFLVLTKPMLGFNQPALRKALEAIKLS